MFCLPVLRTWKRRGCTTCDALLRYNFKRGIKLEGTLSAGAPAPDASGTPGTAIADDVRVTRFRGAHPR